MDEQKLADLKARAANLMQRSQDVKQGADTLKTLSPRPPAMPRELPTNLHKWIEDVIALLQFIDGLVTPPPQPAAGLRPAGVPDRDEGGEALEA